MIAPPTTIAIAIAIATATAIAIAIAIAIVIGMAPAPCAVRRDRDCGATPYHLRAGSRVSAGMRRRGEADGPRYEKTKAAVSHADPSATHAVRSGS